MDTTHAIEDADLANLALQRGWQARQVSLYDEEGVEGWEWSSPSGQTYTCVGDWSAPVIDDDDLRCAIQLSLQKSIN